MMQQRLKKQQALMQQSLYHPALLTLPQSSYGFVDYFDSRSAAFAIVILNGRHFPEVADATLYACFSVYSSCLDARVMWEKRPFKGVWICFLPQDAQTAINDLNGKWLGSRQIRCNWAVKGATGGIDDKQSSDNKNVVELTSGTSDDGHDKANEDAPENNPQYTTVYVGNLSLEATSVDLHRHFHALGAGVIEDVHIQPDKGFGFVRYSTHAEADQAIHLGNCARGEVSLFRPEPVLPHFPLRQWDMSLVYQQLILQHMSSSLLWLGWGVPRLMYSQALMHSQGQRIGVANPSIYDGGYASIATTQPPMYY